MPDATACQVHIQPAPGAVFLTLRLAGLRYTIELTPGEALAVARELREVVGVAIAAG